MVTISIPQPSFNLRGSVLLYWPCSLFWPQVMFCGVTYFESQTQLKLKKNKQTNIFNYGTVMLRGMYSMKIFCYYNFYSCRSLETLPETHSDRETKELLTPAILLCKLSEMRV